MFVLSLVPEKESQHEPQSYQEKMDAVRKNSLLRLVAVGDVGLAPGRRLDIRFAPSPVLMKGMHRNFAVTICALVAFRFLTYMQPFARQDKWPEGLANITTGKTVLFFAVLVAFFFLLWAARFVNVWLSRIFQKMCQRSAPLHHEPASRDRRRRAGDEEQPRWHKTYITSFQLWWRMGTVKIAYLLERNWVGGLSTLFAYMAAIALLAWAHGMQVTNGNAWFAPVVVLCSFVFALFSPVVWLYTGAVRRFGRIEMYDDSREKGRFYSSSLIFARRNRKRGHAAPDPGRGMARPNHVDLWREDIELILAGTHDRCGHTAKDRAYQRILCMEILIPGRKSQYGEALAIDGDNAQARLARTFQRLELQEGSTNLVGALIATLGPGAIFLVAMMAFEIFTTMEIALAAMVWAGLSATEIAEQRRQLSRVLRLGIGDDDGGLPPVFILPKAYRQQLNDNLNDEAAKFFNVVLGVLGGAVVGLFLGLLAIDAARSDSRVSCLLFESCLEKRVESFVPPPAHLWNVSEEA